MKAWLVTWEWSGDHAKANDPFLAIIDPRKSSKNILQLVEFLYAMNTFSISEQIQYANARRFNPYPAEFSRIDGIKWDGHIYCGANPWLFARKVSNLREVKAGEGRNRLLWDEDLDAVERIRKKLSNINYSGSS
jgi:hypothetical protein